MRALLLVTMLGACAPQAKAPETYAFRIVGEPRFASVTVDERTYPLATVAMGAVRLTRGTHRVSVEAPGYLPHDQIVEATGPVVLEIKLVPIPD